MDLIEFSFTLSFTTGNLHLLEGVFLAVCKDRHALDGAENILVVLF